MLRDDSKDNFLSRLKEEVDCKSSVVLSVKPDLIYDPKEIKKNGYSFVVMDYDLKHKAIMLFNPNLGKNIFCFI